MRLDGDRLILSKIGAVHVVLNHPMEGTLKTVTLTRSRTGKWYANTSKICSSCGELVQKWLSDRTHTCRHCGLVLGRDHNAAFNMLHQGLQTLRL